MKSKYYVLIMVLLLAAFVRIAPTFSIPGVEPYKVHKWSVPEISLSIDIESDNSVVKNDLNKLANCIEAIIGAFKDSEYYAFIGNKNYSDYYKIVWAAGFIETQKDILVSKDLFLALASIVKWAIGEEIPMNEDLAKILEFSIPKKSVFPLPPLAQYGFSPYAMSLGRSLSEILIPRLNLRSVDILSNMLRNIIAPIIEIHPKQFEAPELLGSLYAVPMRMDLFSPGMILGDPDAIRACGSEWNGSYYGLSFMYTESGNEAIFSLKGSLLVFSIDFQAKYDLTTGLLKDLYLSANFQNVPYSIYTYQYGSVGLTVSGSIKIRIKYIESHDLEPWTNFGEVIAYKVTDISISPDLEEILNKTGVPISIKSFENLRVNLTYCANPTGLIAEYKGQVYYYNESSGSMIEKEQFDLASPMLMPGGIRVYPYKDILYGQLQLVGHALADVLPRFVKYYLAVARSQGYRVPEFDMHGYYDVLESIQGHFTILANVTFSINYTNVNPGERPFILSGYGGIWLVYKSTGYLVEAGFEFSVKLKYDTDGDGSLDDETLQDYSLKLIINKVVSEEVRAPGWVVYWDQLDSDPPSFSDKQAWKVVTPAKMGEYIISQPLIFGLIIVSVVAIVGLALLIKRRRA
ncbi:MAG: hypothetical protein QXH55_02055 [Candidatus Korarchaeota archaeon]|nr:hypothetical protein [Thermoproteota archaeon]MCR8462911.1 hypothetical protein [Thermoproteota archaeon]MCR8470383.1 hypothetical protein [Thermoproteota archaeon]MCR8472136.1 hypothetical protein [Thermoproteota archaeon]MCR8472941.1 hypothetical protein [Thermoproteota archaeon]